MTPPPMASVAVAMDEPPEVEVWLAPEVVVARHAAPAALVGGGVGEAECRPAAIHRVYISAL